MLDPWIIEEILKREEQARNRERDYAQVELPLNNPSRSGDIVVNPPQEQTERGVVVIDI